MGSTTITAQDPDLIVIPMDKATGIVLPFDPEGTMSGYVPGPGRRVRQIRLPQ